jgi:heat-inducible transcriptional repressor
MDRNPPRSPPPGRADLSSRERAVLRLVVQRFIDTAAPVGSRILVEEDGLEWSSASIRSTMHALEAAGYLDHPHTSAGRVPTERGYRAYVDELMDVRGLTPPEAHLLRETVLRRLGDLDAVARETSRLLGHLTRLLGVVLTPSLATGVLERLEVVPLSSTRVMFVLAVRGGLAHTLVAEVDAAVEAAALDAVVARLNERLAGLTLDELRRTGAARLHDLGGADRTGIVRVVLREAPRLFGALGGGRRASLGGVPHLVDQPEFQQPGEIRSVVELVEDEDVIVHLLERPAPFDPADPARAVGLSGQELHRADARPADPAAPGFAVVTARYVVGDAVGTVGVIGPTRMDYARAVALVEHVAALLSSTAD